MEPHPQKSLTMTERRAHAAYDADCERQGVEASDSARAEFVRGWLECVEEDRQDRIEAQQRDLHRFHP
jgi:hypothetical protein